MSRIGKLPGRRCPRRRGRRSPRRDLGQGPARHAHAAAHRRRDASKKDGDALVVQGGERSSAANAMSGTLRALVANMVNGVTKGFEKKLHAGRRRLPRAGAGRQAQPDARLLASGRAPDAEGRQGRDADPDRDRDQGHRQAAGRPGRRRDPRRTARPSRTRARACATPTSSRSSRKPRRSRRSGTHEHDRQARITAPPRGADAVAAARAAASTRLAVHRSNQHIYAQVIAGDGAKVLAAASTAEKDVRAQLANGGNKAAAAEVGKRIAEKAKTARHRARRVRPRRVQVPRPREGAGRSRARGRAQVLRRARHDADHGEDAMQPRMQTCEERRDGLREKMVAVNRVTKVVKGGRVLGFAALTVVGDGDGGVGMGKGKAREVPVAVQKAMEEARRKMVKVQPEERHAAARGDRPARRVARSTCSRPPKAPASSPAARCARCSRWWASRTCSPSASARPTRTTSCARPSTACASMRTPAEIAAKRGKTVEEITG